MLGSEGEGLRKALLKKSDITVSIEGRRGALNGVDSLNVSVAAGLLCEAFLRPPLDQEKKNNNNNNNNNKTPSPPPSVSEVEDLHPDPVSHPLESSSSSSSNSASASTSTSTSLEDGLSEKSEDGNNSSSTTADNSLW